MPVFADRVKVATATTGTGTLTLGAALMGFQDFAAGGVADGDAVTYVIEDGASVEICTGIYAATGPSLTRDTVHRSIVSGTPGTTRLTLSGNAVLFVTARGADLAQAAEVAALTAQAESLAARLVSLEDETYLEIGVI
jgi:hypothetical protein